MLAPQLELAGLTSLVRQLGERCVKGAFLSLLLVMALPFAPYLLAEGGFGQAHSEAHAHHHPEQEAAVGAHPHCLKCVLAMSALPASSIHGVALRLEPVLAAQLRLAGEPVLRGRKARAPPRQA